MKEKEKQSKALNLEYKKLEIQEYFVEGNENTELANLIFKPRSIFLDIKLQKKWKYQDTMCVGCDKNEESGIEILQCEGFNDGEKDRISDGSLYSKFFDDSTSETS